MGREWRRWGRWNVGRSHANSGGGGSGGTTGGHRRTPRLGPTSGPPASISPIGGDGASADPTDSTKRRRELLDSQESLKFIADQTGGLAIENTNDLESWNPPSARRSAGLLPAWLLGSAGRSTHGMGPGSRQGARQAPWTARPSATGFLRPLRRQANRTLAPADPLVVSALSPFGSGGIAVRLTSVFGHDEKTGSFVRSLSVHRPSRSRVQHRSDGQAHRAVSGPVDGHRRQRRGARWLAP